MFKLKSIHMYRCLGVITELFKTPRIVHLRAWNIKELKKQIEQKVKLKRYHFPNCIIFRLFIKQSIHFCYCLVWHLLHGYIACIVNLIVWKKSSIALQKLGLHYQFNKSVIFVLLTHLEKKICEVYLVLCQHT